MTTDCNATLGNWPFRRLRDNDPETFIELMDRHEIGQAWVSPFEAVFYKAAQDANRQFTMELAALGDRLIQVPVLDPTCAIWEDDFAEYLEYPLPGVRLYPTYHGYALNDPACAALLQATAEAGRFAQIVVRVQDERLHHPLVQVPPLDLQPLPKLAARFPALPLMVLNASIAEVRSVAGEACPQNVCFDISHVDGAGCVSYLAADIGADHIVFGSHAPFFYIESSLLKMQEADLSEEDTELILSANAEGIVGRNPE